MYQDRQDNDFSRHIPPPIDETFDPVAREPGRPSPNPSVTPITGSPVFHPCYYRFLLRLSRNTFFPLFPFRKKEESEPNRGAGKDHEEGSPRRGTTRTRPDRTRRLSYPPCTAATAVFHWRVIAWRKPWLQPAAGAPCITSPIRGDERFGGVHCDRVI